MNTKVCSKCNNEKSVVDFYKRSTSKDGLQSNCKACKTNYNKDHYIKNKDSYSKRRQLWRENQGKPWQRHGMTEKSFEEMVGRFDGLCWCCQSVAGMVIDHDHSCCAKTYSCGSCVRGWLCVSCNLALGKLGDTVESLNRALLYVSGNL